MLDTLSRYVYEVYRLKSVSLAAQNLFISQPALSTAIRKVEQELGAPIFNRKTLPFTLTAEGRIYMESIEKMLALEAQTAERIREVQQVRGGALRIASSAHLSHRLLPKLLQWFHRLYPQVETNIFHVESSILIAEKNILFERLEKNLVDVVLLPLDAVPEGYCATRLFTQQLVVCIPAHTSISPELQRYAVTWQELVDRTYPAEKIISELSLFREVEFVHVPPGSYITKKRTVLFGEYGIAPYVTSNTSHVLMNYNLMLSGFGALLTTDTNIATMPPNEDCRYFVLGGAAARQDFCAVYQEKEGSSMNSIHAFIGAAQELLEQKDYMQLLSGFATM